ncbi:MAG TPA: FimV/HubP family polar landmark protein, partial [Gammaproteobacteria bacterium]|nr:FimV/HubP family polar landmark protein [Gammaproteobacteria bacterium]
YSYLGEPLYAEIDLTGVDVNDANLLQVSLANAKEFARAGIERPYFLTNLNFQVITYEKKLIVVVRTSKPVQSPYLEFLIALAWPGGDLIKEYTILLDPPPADLTSATRNKGYGQMAEEAARKASLTESPIQQQINLQKAQAQKKAAEAALKDVVHEGSKFSDQTFDLDIPKKPGAPAPGQPATPGHTGTTGTPATSGPTAPTGDVNEQGAYAQQRAKFTQEHAQAKAPTTLLQEVVSDLEENKNDQNTKLTIEAILADEQKHQAAEAATLKTTPQTAAQTPGHAAEQTPAQPGGQAPAQTPAQTHDQPTGHDGEQVNFSQVIKPSTSPTDADQKPQQLADKSRRGGIGASVQATPPKPPTPKSNYLYLGIILSLLLVAAGVAIAIKRGLLTNLVHKQQPEIEETPAAAPTEQPFADHTDENEFHAAIREFTQAEDADTEHIEITAVPAATAASPTETQATEAMPMQAVTEAPATSEIKEAQPDLDKFEEEFTNINLDELGMPQEPSEPEQPAPMPEAVPTSESASQSDIAEFNPVVETQATEPAATETPVTQTPVEEAPAAVQQPTLELAAEEPAAAPTNAAPAPGATDQVTGTTLTQEPESNLVLSEEGATLVGREEDSALIDNSEAVAKKIELAKQYIETGDNESAKDLLHEVIEVANDEQKLAAQILLTSIE